MRLDILDSKHPTYNKDRWCQLDALSKGGEHFQKLISTFLPQNPVEPGDVYAQRQAQAHYRSYLSTIVNLYVGWLFASGFSTKAYQPGTKDPVEDLPPFYSEFQEDVGAETQLSSFMQERFRDALTMQQAAWLIEFPSNDGVEPDTAKDFEDRGLGRATLKAIERHEMFDWEEDEHGELNWVNIHTQFEVRKSWAHARNTVVETWRIYEREYVHTFQMEYDKDKGRPRDPKHDVAKIDEAPHGFKRVPVVRLCIPKELCIGEAVFDTQLEYFRLDNALSWLIRRTCYAQPVFNLDDGENTPPRMGAGYAILLGKDDKMGWTSPPVAPFDILQKNIDSKREEIYRIVHQMAQAVDNNAETVGRSADSKEIDAAATRIMLNAYGKIVAERIEEMYEIISEARGEEEVVWSIEGFSGYDTATVSSLIGNTIAAAEAMVPSPTFHRELRTKMAMAMMPEVDQTVKDTIRAEIKSASDDVVMRSVEDVAVEAKAKLDMAKAEAEPVKAKAAMKSASRPQPSPSAKPAAKKPTPKK
jgi:gas vesicle protein